MPARMICMVTVSSGMCCDRPSSPRHCHMMTRDQISLFHKQCGEHVTSSVCSWLALPEMGAHFQSPPLVAGTTTSVVALSRFFFHVDRLASQHSARCTLPFSLLLLSSSRRGVVLGLARTTSETAEIVLGTQSPIIFSLDKSLIHPLASSPHTYSTLCRPNTPWRSRAPTSRGG